MPYQQYGDGASPNSAKGSISKAVPPDALSVERGLDPAEHRAVAATRIVDGGCAHREPLGMRQRADRVRVVVHDALDVHASVRAVEAEREVFVHLPRRRLRRGSR